MNNNFKENSLLQSGQNLVNILKFLDPKTIANLVLVCRALRLDVGNAIGRALEIQQKYYKKIEDSYYLTINYLEYKQLLQQCHIFRDETAYFEFVDKMNQRNQFYYINFFSIIFNQQIKINKLNVQEKKDELKKLSSNEIYLSLFRLQFDFKIPKLQTQHIYLECYDIKQSEIILFVNRLLARVKALQKMDNPLDNFIIYQQYNKSYMQTFKRLPNIKLSNQYRQKIYYLTFGKSYHSEINFNVNSVILSFLNMKDLQKVRIVNQKFNKVVKNTGGIILSRMLIRIESMLQKQSVQVELKHLRFLVNKNQQNHMNQFQLYSLNLTQDQPLYIDKLYNIFLDILGFSPQNTTFNQIKDSYKIYEQIFVKPYSHAINKEKFQILDLFFKEEDLELISSHSPLSRKICSNLYILYYISKNRILPSQIDAYQKDQIQISQQISYAQKFKIYLNRIKVECS